MIQGGSDVDLSVTVALGIELINNNARPVLGLDDLATDDLFNCPGRLPRLALEPRGSQPNP